LERSDKACRRQPKGRSDATGNVDKHPTTNEPGCSLGYNPKSSIFIQRAALSDLISISIFVAGGGRRVAGGGIRPSLARFLARLFRNVASFR